MVAARKQRSLVAYCAGAKQYCAKAFYFDSAIFDDTNTTRLVLLNPNETQRNKYYEIKRYIANHPH
jgi:uncharacterized protein YhbP (UPF0306 family)